MNDVQVGRFSQLLHKLLGIREGSPAPTLAPELFAFLPVADYQPDWDFLKGVYRKSNYRNIAAGGAGQYGHHEFANPAGSGVIAIFTRFMNVGSAVTAYFRSYIGTVIGSPSQGFNLDSRAPRWGDGTGQSSVIQCGYGTGGSVLGTQLVTVHMLQGVVYEPGPIIVTPGNTLLVIDATANQSWGINAWWYERALEPSER